MWILRSIFCLFQGHTYIDITPTARPYQYCLHCGKIKEPMAVVKNRRLHSFADQHP
jgi:hypothetical protein